MTSRASGLEGTIRSPRLGGVSGGSVAFLVAGSRHVANRGVILAFPLCLLYTLADANPQHSNLPCFGLPVRSES